jgi:hypothetical protein
MDSFTKTEVILKEYKDKYDTIRLAIDDKSNNDLSLATIQLSYFATQSMMQLKSEDIFNCLLSQLHLEKGLSYHFFEYLDKVHYIEMY